MIADKEDVPVAHEVVELPCITWCMMCFGVGFLFLTTLCFVLFFTLYISSIAGLIENLDSPVAVIVQAIFNNTLTGADQNPASLSATCIQIGYSSCAGTFGRATIQTL